MQPVLIVTGPTACGKSALALELARDLGGEIVNLDSMQVYRGFDIGTAKPSVSERGVLPHHLFDIRDPNEESNIALYLDEALRATVNIQERGGLSVFAGGSTLYLTCLLHGLAELPSADSAIRLELEKQTGEALFKELLAVDPESAAVLAPGDRLRVMRALETWRVTGVKPSAALKEHGHRENRLNALILLLCWPRPELYARINERASKMVERGLLGEVAALVEKHGRELFAFKSLGYAQALRCLAGELELEKLAEEISMQTRRYAKRQMTYFRNEPGKRGWKVLPEGGQGDELDAAPVRGPGAGAKTFRVLRLDWQTLKRAVRERLAQPFSGSEIWCLDAKAIGRLD